MAKKGMVDAAKKATPYAGRGRDRRTGDRVGVMAAEDTLLTPAQDLRVTTDKVTVQQINSRLDESEWNVRMSLGVNTPERGAEDRTVRVNENHRVHGNVGVTVAEVASQAGIAEEEVRTTLTLEQVATHVKAVAIRKFCTAMGLTLPGA